MPYKKVVINGKTYYIRDTNALFTQGPVEKPKPKAKPQLPKQKLTYAQAAALQARLQADLEKSGGYGTNPSLYTKAHPTKTKPVKVDPKNDTFKHRAAATLNMGMHLLGLPFMLINGAEDELHKITHTPLARNRRGEVIHTLDLLTAPLSGYLNGVNDIAKAITDDQDELTFINAAGMAALSAAGARGRANLVRQLPGGKTRTASLRTQLLTKGVKKTAIDAVKRFGHSLVMGAWRSKQFLDKKWPAHSLYMQLVFEDKAKHYDLVAKYTLTRSELEHDRHGLVVRDINNHAEDTRGRIRQYLDRRIAEIDKQLNTAGGLLPTNTYYLNFTGAVLNPEKMTERDAHKFMDKHHMSSWSIPYSEDGKFIGFMLPEETHTVELGLAPYVTTGKVLVPNFGTKTPLSFNIEVPGYSVARSTRPVVNIDGKVVKDLGNKTLPTESNTTLSVPAGYQLALQAATAHLTSKFKGAKGFGSSLAAAKAGFAHGTHDFDFLITEEDFNKNVKNHPELLDLRVIRSLNDGKPATYNGIYQSDIWGSGKDSPGALDFNIVYTDPKTGMATGFNAVELFRQYFPDDYSLALRESKLRGMNGGDYDIRINKTAKLLMDAYDPVQKTITDSFEIDFRRPNKDKHAGRPMVHLSYSDPQLVSKGLQAFGYLTYGSKFQLPPRVDAKHFSDINANKLLLKLLGIPVDIEAVAANPAKMLNALDYWTIYNTGFMRAFDMGDFHESNVTDLSKSWRNATEWNPQSTGGNAHGFGLNFVTLGNSGAGRSAHGFVQPEIKWDYNKAYSPQEIIERIKRNNGEFNVSADEAGIVNDLLAEHVPSSNYRIQAGAPLHSLLALFSRNGLDVADFGYALSDKLGVSNITTPYDYMGREHGARYSSGMRKFNRPNDAVMIVDNADPVPVPIETRAVEMDRRKQVPEHSLVSATQRELYRAQSNRQHSAPMNARQVAKRISVNMMEPTLPALNKIMGEYDRNAELVKQRLRLDHGIQLSRSASSPKLDYLGKLNDKRRQKLLNAAQGVTDRRLNFWRTIGFEAGDKARTARQIRNLYQNRNTTNGNTWTYGLSYYDKNHNWVHTLDIHIPGMPAWARIYKASERVRPGNIATNAVKTGGLLGGTWFAGLLSGMLHRDNWLDDALENDSVYQELDQSGRWLKSDESLDSLNSMYDLHLFDYEDAYPWGLFIIGHSSGPKPTKPHNKRITKTDK